MVGALTVPMGSALASEPPPLVIVVSAPKAAAGAIDIAWVIRRGAMEGQAVTVTATPGAVLSAPDATGHCNPTATGSVLDLPAATGLPPPAVCVRSDQAGTVVLLASGVDANNQLHVSEAASAEFAAPRHFWQSSAFATLLSAAVGFIFGLGSTWIGGLLDGWKAKRALRRAGEEFMATALYPELADHLKHVKAYMSASESRRQDLCIVRLSQKQLTEANYQSQVNALTAYLKAADGGKALADVKQYDTEVQKYNQLAEARAQQAAAQRDVTAVTAAVADLQRRLGAFGLS